MVQTGIKMNQLINCPLIMSYLCLGMVYTTTTDKHDKIEDGESFLLLY